MSTILYSTVLYSTVPLSCLVISGVLFSDFGEIIQASESQEVKNNKSNNGDILECKSESESEAALMIKLLYAGTNLTFNLYFSSYQPWMAGPLRLQHHHQESGGPGHGT